MRFEPKSETEVAAGQLLPPGTYDFEISAATEEVSKAGNDMIKLKLHVYTQDGGRTTIFDYLMEKIAYKLRHAAFACNLGDKYEAGMLEADDFVGRSGRVKLNIQKDKAGQYPDRNNIADYMVEEGGSAAPKPAPRAMATADLDDEIPF